MEWITEFRIRITRDYERARQKARELKGEYERAAALWSDAHQRENELRRLVEALDQCDPLTRVPEPPL